MIIGRIRGPISGLLSLSLSVVAVFAASAPCVAQTVVVDEAPAAPAGPAPAAGPFERNGFGIEFTGAALGEAWNLNERREWLLDGTASVWWSFRARAALLVEFHATRVFQEESRNAFVNGLSPMIRWQVAQRGDWRFFVEGGAGISWSDTVVPPRGTRFNYLLIAGGGVTRRIGAQTHAVLGARLLHVSNASLEGPSRNPDIEAVGGFFGVAIAF